jgi:Kef-type K+ transport system membrane component KefB
LGFLFLLAGYELDFGALRARPGQLAIAGWIIGVALAMTVVGGLAATGFVHAFVPVSLALTTTAFGILLPILRENDLLVRPLGSQVVAAGAVGEFFPIVAIAALASTFPRSCTPRAESWCSSSCCCWFGAFPHC